MPPMHQHGGGGSGGMSGRYTQLLGLAVFVLFIHAIIQQNMLSNLRSELQMSLDRADVANKKSAGVEYYLNTKSPPNKPSVIVTDAKVEEKIDGVRDIYGGKKDALHLGGFTEADPMGISENLWHYMMGPLAIKSIVDVGCGKGVSTKFFLQQGAKILCVEGSHDAVMQSLLPPEMIVEHDFSRGPWWPEETFDAVWSVEFLEHVSRPYMRNYLPIFKKSALLFVTSSAWGGWHHVEVHEEWWWRARMAAQGFIYSEELTSLVRLQASNGVSEYRFSKINKDTAKIEHEEHRHDAQHLWTRMLVFVNPEIASLPQHHHLFGGNGCFNNVVDNRDGGKPCGLDEKDLKGGIEKTDVLPTKYQSILSCFRTTSDMKDKGSWKDAIWECTKNPAASLAGQQVSHVP